MMVDAWPELKATGDVIKNAPGWLDRFFGVLDKYHMLPMWKWRADIARTKAALEEELADDKAVHERRRETLRICNEAEANGIAKITSAQYDIVEAQIRKNMERGTNPLSAFMCDPLAVRAMKGWLWTTIEERYAQERIAKLACLAAFEQLGGGGGGGQTSEEFFVRFWDMARGIRDEDALRFFGRLLAGEIYRAGSISLRTLDVLYKMTATEAQLLKRYSIYTFNAVIFVALNTISQPKSLTQDWNRLYDAGLVEAQHIASSFTLESGQTATYSTAGISYYIKNTGPRDVLLSGGTLTEAGRELIAMDSLPPDFEAIKKMLLQSVSDVLECGVCEENSQGDTCRTEQGSRFWG